MFTAIASTLNTIDTAATVTERAARITGTVLWLAAFTAVAVTGACFNATYEAREAYAVATVEQAQFIDELQAERFMLPAAPAAAAVTFQEFVTQALQPIATVDLAELMVAEPVRHAAAAIAPLPTLTITEPVEPTSSWSYDELIALKAKELKAMAKEQGLTGYGSMRKAQLAEALAA